VRRVASRNLDERVHGRDGNAVSREGHALAPGPSEVTQSQLPVELRDRVAAPPEWLPVGGETPPPRHAQPSSDAPVLPSLLPRFHLR
jgi:hypothetical protein